MKESIKDLNKIYDEYSRKYFTPEIESSFHKLGKYYGTYDFIKPFLEPLKFDDIEFYILDRYLDTFRDNYKNHRIVDENYKVLNDKTVIEILKEYGKGFRESYFSYKNPLRPHIPKNIDRNRKLISKIYDIIAHKEPQPYGVISTTFLSKNEITIRKIIEDLEESYYHSQFYQITKKDIYDDGYKGGLFYKAWEIILENRPLFNEIFKKKAEQNRNFYSPKPKIENKTVEVKKETKIIETPDLSIKDIPKFNLLQRFYLFKLLGLETSIHQLKTDIQGSKYKVLASIMGISPDNAKKLICNSYKKGITEKDKAEVKDFLYRNKIEL
ncbi:hypothetical protein [Polaribacter septentrionalilitoris]|uniref:hypothetical protein n=1 Tax=Polaribacter septentrionalilitoris TaxID=2494657 RepID=UPI001356E756|nr:hypothetical protein [Polaribacter septentrionalilitoris]